TWAANGSIMGPQGREIRWRVLTSRSSQQRGSGIGDCIATILTELKGFATDLNIAKGKLPIRFAGERHISDGSSVMFRVSSSKRQLSSLATGVSIQPEGKY